MKKKYLNILRDISAARDMVKLGEGQMRQASLNPDPLLEILSKALKELEAIANKE